MTFESRLSPSTRGAWALTALLASVVAGAACGGNVSVEQSQGSVSSSTGPATVTGTGTGVSTMPTGSGGGSPGNTGNGGSTSSGVFVDGGTCSPVLGPEQMMEEGCFASTFCPQSTDPSAREQLNLALGFCNQEKTACCDKTVIDQIACGPFNQSGMCCYVAIYSTFQCGE